MPPRIDYSEVERILENNLQDEFYKLDGIPGHRLDKASFAEVQAAIAEGGVEGIGKMARRPEQSVEYYVFRRKMLKQYRSMADLVQISKLQYPSEKGPDGRLQAVLTPESKAEHRTYWLENDFPYSLVDGLEHHLLWSTQPLSENHMTQVISENRKGYEYVKFVNPEILMSIPGVWHAHVMSRPLANKHPVA